MRRHVSAAVTAAVVLGAVAACSADKLGPDTPPPPKDASVATDIATPTDAAMPADAATPTDAGTPPDAGTPFPIALQFRNDTGAPLYIHKGCAGVDYGLSSSSSGFRDRLGPTYRCGCYCDEASCTAQPTCGACPEPEGVELAPGGMLAVTWDGVQITDDVKPRAGTNATFGCLRSRALPSGIYRVAIRVFDGAVSAATNVDGRIVTRDFDVPSALGAVDVPLSINALDTCDPQPSAAAPTCTGAEEHDLPCSLAEPLGFAWEGGLSFWGDASHLTPPTSYSRVRTFYQDATKPDMTCVTHVPRCTRDSRIVTTADVTRVVNDPDVRAAYGPGTPVYGYDSRNNDGAVLILRRPDATSLAIGATCSTCPVARPLTPALTAIGPVLGTLEQQMMSTSACLAFRPAGVY